jgi:hypothetical protein
MASGDDIEAGRATGANSTTFLVGEKPDDDNPPDFNGDFIFVVGPLQNPSGRSPAHTTGGILGLGWNGSTATAPPSTGGVGVMGLGGPNQGTGVLGLGGAAERGNGGIGIPGRLPLEVAGEANAPTVWIRVIQLQKKERQTL